MRPRRDGLPVASKRSLRARRAGAAGERPSQTCRHAAMRLGAKHAACTPPAPGRQGTPDGVQQELGAPGPNKPRHRQPDPIRNEGRCLLSADHLCVVRHVGVQRGGMRSLAERRRELLPGPGWRQGCRTQRGHERHLARAAGAWGWEARTCRWRRRLAAAAAVMRPRGGRVAAAGAARGGDRPAWPRCARLDGQREEGVLGRELGVSVCSRGGCARQGWGRLRD